MCDNKCYIKDEVNKAMYKYLQTKFDGYCHLVKHKPGIAPSHVELYFYSPGGGLKATFDIVDLIKEFREQTGLKIHGIITKNGKCASAAALIFGICDVKIMHKKAEILIHAPRMHIDDIELYNEGSLIYDEEHVKKLAKNGWFTAMFFKSCAKEAKEMEGLSKRLFDGLNECYDFRKSAYDLKTIFAQEMDQTYGCADVRAMVPVFQTTKK